MNHRVHAVVLAAGKATRFGTGQSKQLVTVCGVPMVRYIVDALRDCHSGLSRIQKWTGPSANEGGTGLPVTVVVGHQADEVAAAAGVGSDEQVTSVLQVEQRGTGHAVLCAQSAWEKSEHILVVNGDMPLLTTEAIESLLQKHLAEENVITFATTELADPTGYGRVINNVFPGKDPGPRGLGPGSRPGKSSFLIKEEKECTAAEKAITTVNAGIYVIKHDFAQRALAQLTASTTTGELYITDLVAIAGTEGCSVGTHHLDETLVRGVNTLAELATAEAFLYDRIRQSWQQRGVRLIDPSSILIEKEVCIGRGSTIGRGVHLQGKTSLGEQVVVEAYSMLRNATVHNDAHIYSHSVIEDSAVGVQAEVGPFARLRGAAAVNERAVVGNFVEMKKSTLGAGSKAKHLAYLGDTTVGEQSNIGAGVITCNYDGKNKHKTVIGDRVMIGADSNLVAPVTVEDNAFVAAGSTVTRDVPEGALGIGRARQENKEGWAMRKICHKK